MSEAEIKKIYCLANSEDLECKKLAIGLLEEAFPDSFTYDEYLKTYQSWMFYKENKYFLKYYYDFIDIGYMQYLELQIPAPTLQKYKERFKLCTDG